MGEVRAASVSMLSVGADPGGDQQAAADAPSREARLRRLETVDPTSVADALRLLDRKQLRRLVEDLDAALRDEVPRRRDRTAVATSGALIGGIQAAAGGEEGKGQGSERTAPTLAPLQVKSTSPQPQASAATSPWHEMRLTVRRRSRRRPRRVLVALASAFLAVIFISFLFVPAVDPPRQSVAVAIQTSHTEPAVPRSEEASTAGRSSGDVASSLESPRSPTASNQVGPGKESRAAVEPIPRSEARAQAGPGATTPPSAREGVTTGGDPRPSATPSVDAQPKPGARTASRSADTPEQGPHHKLPTPQSKAEVKPPLQAPAPDVSPSEPATSRSPEMVQTLIDRAVYLLLQRDVAGARMFYERAAEAGSIVAASGVARTYDPLFLRWIGAVGIRGDKTKAIYWYRRASEGGDRAATERLALLLAEGSE